MADPLIDLRALLVEREDCNAGTVTKLREALAQGQAQFKNLREVGETLKRKVETAAPALAKNLHLKVGIVQYFLGHTNQAVEQLKQAEGGSPIFISAAL